MSTRLLPDHLTETPDTHGAFPRLDEQQIAALAMPPLEIAIGEETEQRLPDVADGLSLALGRSFPIIDRGVKNPATGHWERPFRSSTFCSDRPR
jgi:hypothetical protein